MQIENLFLNILNFCTVKNKNCQVDVRLLNLKKKCFLPNLRNIGQQLLTATTVECGIRIHFYAEFSGFQKPLKRGYGSALISRSRG